MTNSKKKKIFLIMIIIILIIVILIVLMKKFKNINTNLPEEIPDDLSNTEINNIDSTLKRVEIRNNYYYVKNCVINFYSLLDIKSINTSDKNEISNEIISMLDKQYIEYSGITNQNLFEKVNTYNGANIVITDMFVSQRSFNISAYFVYGNIRENGKNSKFSLIVKVDRTNNTFKIYLQDYMEKKYSDIRLGDNIFFDDTSDFVENNTNNVFEYRNISNEQYAEDIFNNIKFYIMYDNETLYNMLDEEYKNKFLSYNEFYDFISKNYLLFMKMSFGNYNKQYLEQSTQYILIDSDNKFRFVVSEEAPFKFSLSIEKN